MFGFGHGPELIIILVIALIVLGPGKIPEIAQMLGKGIRELRQASADLQKTFDVNELMNPAPSAPPPVEPAPPPVPAAAVETIAPPETAAAVPARPKRTRKRPAPAAETGASNVPMSSEGISSEQPVVETSGTEPARKPRARRRPSKPAPETVSLDVPA